MVNQQYLPANPQAAVRTSQIIVGALVMGIVTFAMIASFIGMQKAEPQEFDAGDPWSLIALCMTAGVLGAWFVVPNIVDAAARKNTNSEDWTNRDRDDRDRELGGRFLTRTIVSSALLEGVAFFGLISVIITGQFWFAGLAGLMLVLMAFTFPTFGRFESWADNQQRLIEHQT